MAWGMTWGLFPLLSSCLLMGVKDFSGKTVPKDVAVNRGRNGWSRAFNLLSFKRKQADSTELGQPHKPDIKELSRYWCCCMNLLQLSWYKIEGQRHSDPAGIGNACPTLPPCSPLLYECLVHPGNEESQDKAAGKCCIFCKKSCSHPGLLLLGAVRTENCTWGYFPGDGKGALLNKARLQASQHTTALAIK